MQQQYPSIKQKNTNFDNVIGTYMPYVSILGFIKVIITCYLYHTVI